jgi:ATP synthase protein I
MVGADQASIMGMELVAAILTWSGIGWLVDRWLGTAPWFLVVGGLVGNAAGLYLIWLRSGRMEQRDDDPAGATPAAADDATEGGE